MRQSQYCARFCSALFARDATGRDRQEDQDAGGDWAPRDARLRGMIGRWFKSFLRTKGEKRSGHGGQGGYDPGSLSKDPAAQQVGPGVGDDLGPEEQGRQLVAMVAWRFIRGDLRRKIE